MLKLSVRREDANGPWLELGLSAGQINLQVNVEKKVLMIQCVGLGNNGTANGKLELAGDDFDKLVGLIEQSKLQALANKQTPADG
jgi:hypothetical protein